MGQIKVEKNAGGIEGLCTITPTVHGDARGYFVETYNQNDMKEAGLTMKFVQDNQSSSTKGVLCICIDCLFPRRLLRPPIGKENWLLPDCCLYPAQG